MRSHKSTPCGNLLLQKPAVSHPDKKFHAFYGIRTSFTVSARYSHFSTSWVRWIQSTHSCFLDPFEYYPQHYDQVFQRLVFWKFSQPNPVLFSAFSHACLITRVSHSAWLNDLKIVGSYYKYNYRWYFFCEIRLQSNLTTNTNHESP